MRITAIALVIVVSVIGFCHHSTVLASKLSKIKFSFREIFVRSNVISNEHPIERGLTNFLFGMINLWLEEYHSMWVNNDLARNSIRNLEVTINYRRTRRFYGQLHLSARDRSRLYAFNTRRRGTFLVWCNRMMIRYRILTTHATIRGNSPLCGYVLLAGKTSGEFHERIEKERVYIYVYILTGLLLYRKRGELIIFWKFDQNNNLRTRVY